ncbi:MAG: tRNA (adenosine(37)-N6)-dimethylallyltransferase MiaA, partial [Desulfuromonadales bacterium]|nr:tRNA (adenosine(37)-N6)-dimethylallyltransferase MiaA [Desulfuromonadales bacterium]
GAGKDLEEYRVESGSVPYHLIDIAGLDEEFSVYAYQRQCFETIEALWSREAVPVIVGGTGMYLEAVLKGYRMVEAPANP